MFGAKERILRTEIVPDVHGNPRGVRNREIAEFILSPRRTRAGLAMTSGTISARGPKITATTTERRPCACDDIGQAIGAGMIFALSQVPIASYVLHSSIYSKTCQVARFHEVSFYLKLDIFMVIVEMDTNEKPSAIFRDHFICET